MDSEARRHLVEVATRFASAFQRWAESAAPDCPAAEGFNFAGLRLLEQLHCQGPQMMRAIADELGLTPRNVTALVDGLEGEGLVRRTPHPSDRRVTLVEATPKGLAVAEETIGPKLAAIGELFDDLSPDDQERLAELLTAVVDGLRARGQRC
ncbi:MAG TPA: MarR family transcriptional regulator [Acidimicrobiales bacterium]